MSQHFTHLHLHTEYSLLDGAISLDKLVEFGKTHNYKALAITDHGNIFGAVKFFQKCKKAGIKPILGMEAYFTEDAKVKNQDNKYYHLILLVQNQIGYKNLCKLISYSYQEGFYFKPRIDYNILEKHSEGLIVTSACLGGHIPKLLMADNHKEVNERVDWFLRVFGRDRFFLEVQPEDQQEQVILNQKLFDLAQTKNLNCVAAGDCHYVSLDDHEAHEIMLSIQTQAKMDSPNRFSFGDCRAYMRTTEQMLDEFKDHQHAVWNAGMIADMCNFDFETDKLFFPQFLIPENYTQESYFAHMCRIGLQRLKDEQLILHDRIQEYDDRLEIEIDLISKMGFVGYFLVVSDFIQWAYRAGIPVGPGRGSAAGSLVAWALQITNIDPLKYNLLFERFLNPERVSMPDIDIDFCIEGRDKVINYVRDKYGHDKVCNIITFGTMMAKGVIKDVARVLGFSFEDSNAMTNLIPEQLKITLTEALEQEPRLTELINNNPRTKHIFDIAFKLEGLTRHASKHAAGIVISPEPIDEVLPVYIPPKSNELVTQYAMTELEAIGFLKIDFLGLKNLTLIDRVLQLVKKNYGITIDINKLPLDDAKTFELMCEGKTSGVFQFESSGLKEVIRKLKPDKFEDLVALNALYRPGPLGSGMIEDFIERRHGRQPIKYLFPELEPILAETFGVVVYQEQVMKVASAIGGYSLGEADILRRAMGKKKAEVMAEQGAIFVERASALGFNGKKAQELFDLLAYFAGYGFNKSHAAAYTLITYQTAYLKANYLPEFLACLISLEATHPDKMSFYLQEAKDLSITLLPPDINKSNIDFSVVNGNILFGLQGIKNVGLAALENIIEERSKKGPFKDLLDFCKRVDLRTANKRVIESLICAGAFDTLHGNRAQQYAEVERIIDLATTHKKNSLTGQMDMFSASKGANNNNEDMYLFSPLPDWPDKEKLEKEREVVGFYISSHPLETYKKQLAWFAIESFESATEKAKTKTGEYTTISCGLLKTRKDIVTKKGDRMSFLQFEDMSGSAEIIAFPKTFAKTEKWLSSYHVFIIKGVIDTEVETGCKIKANDIIPVELVLSEWPTIENILFTLPDDITEETIIAIKKELTKGTAPLHLSFQENEKKLRLTTKEKILLSAESAQLLEKYNITIRCSL
ncbi:MAG TPA: DNA polymerase III subunit alpha [Candidatus Babeliales bacterium]|jgi:DNA polymerase-3 subunit alpha|nr:DNA polymerase III subunit alpha [Candidatus Babeliales bacterium]